MKILSKILTVSALLVAITPIIVPAATLPKLPDSDKITTGTLANGIRYYIVTNPTHKGTADIALVQKAGKLDEPVVHRGGTGVQAMASLTDLPHFSISEYSPFSFLKGNSIRPDKSGYVTVSENATIYRFNDLLQANKPDIVDSTLLMVFDIIGRDNRPIGQLYSPSDQAIIISGDINAGALLGKMDMLSMFVNKKNGVAREKRYEWQDRERAFKMIHSWTDNAVEAQFRSPRAPFEEMGTVLPLVSSRYAKELEIILKRRLFQALSSEGVPYRDISFSYRSGSDNPGDETTTVGISTSAEYLEKAAAILARTLACLDENGVSAKEYSNAQNKLALELLEEYGSPVVENSKYVDKCISAFLYGSSLASDDTNLDFFLDRNMPVEQATTLFNNYISALLDKSANLTVRCTADTYRTSEESVSKAFTEGWKVSGDRNGGFRSSPDTTKLKKQNGKLKVKIENPEPLFGGTMITYANGIKVIYRRTPTKGMINYAWLLKGGYGSMPDLKEGEGPYIQDMLGLYRVGDMSGAEFADMLNGNGISMQSEVSLSGFTVMGSAKADKLRLLMKSLHALASDRSIDMDAYNYYRECQALQDHGNDMYAKLDSLMTKDLSISPYKRSITLSDDLPKRAEKYYDNVFGRMNDGVLIIVGDVSETSVRSAMSQYLGSFRTDRAYTYRSKLKDNRIAGRKTVYEWGKEPEIGIAMSAQINYTSDNYMAACVAATAMEEAVADAVASSGWTMDAISHVALFPDESLNMSITLSQVNPNGLPASLASVDSADIVLSKARKAIYRLGTEGITPEVLNTGKTVVMNYYDSWKGDPRTIGTILALRYSYGKDIFTNYGGKIAAVSAEKVNPILKDLSRGGIAEYVVRKNRQEIQEPPVEDKVRLEIPEMLPAEGQLVYPFEGMTVPLDTLDLSELEFIPPFIPEGSGDDVDGGQAAAVPSEDAVGALQEGTVEAAEQVVEGSGESATDVPDEAAETPGETGSTAENENDGKTASGEDGTNQPDESSDGTVKAEEETEEGSGTSGPDETADNGDTASVQEETTENKDTPEENPDGTENRTDGDE